MPDPEALPRKYFGHNKAAGSRGLCDDTEGSQGKNLFARRSEMAFTRHARQPYPLTYTREFMPIRDGQFEAGQVVESIAGESARPRCRGDFKLRVKYLTGVIERGRRRD